MGVLLLVKVAAVTLPWAWVAESHPLSPLSRVLPTPHQLKYELTKRRVTSTRELLEVTTRLREAFEQDDDPRCKAAVERLKRHEADLRRQIAEHEAFLALPAPPPPAVPLYRPGRQPPAKPPIRD